MKLTSHKTLRLYGRLLLQAKPYWPHIAAFSAVSLLATPLALLTPVPLKIAVDNVLGSAPLPEWLRWAIPASWVGSETMLVVAVAGLVVLFALLALTHQVIHAIIKTYTGERLVMAFRDRLFRHVQRLSLSYHDMKGTADSTYRIQYDAPSIQNIVIESLVPTIGAVFMLVTTLVVTAKVSPKLALVALAVTPILLSITFFFSGRLRQRWRDVKKLESSAQSVVQEVLGAVRVVKAFNRESQEQDRFVAQSNHGIAARLKAAVQENCYNLLVGLTIAAGTAAVLLVGVTEVKRQALTLGDLLLVMAYLKQLFDPLKTIGKQLASKQRALASAERAFDLLDELPDVAERPNARPLKRATGHFAFRNVSFRYGDGPLVCRDLSIDILAGSKVGILGRTGAGKTTTMNLLTRFYDPTGGGIYLDGVDLRDYKLEDLRQQYAIVLQEPVLFSTTIGENIAYGRTGATEAEIVAAAVAADADAFIRAMPDGYSTLVGERGMRLSGGERQRISLARAFLRDAPILILDEPTSSVDTKTEASIMAAMHRLMAGRTTLMIAHRLTTLSMCDVLLKLDGGALRQISHEELMHLEPAEHPTARDETQQLVTSVG